MILSVQDIFCCILNTLFKSKIWAKIDELVQERDHTKQCSSSCEKKKKKKQGVMIDSLFFYLVTPSFPAKKGNRTLSLSGTVRYYRGADLWNSLPSSIRKTKSLANFRHMSSVSVNWQGIQWKQALIFLSSFRFYVKDICLFLLLSFICIYIIVHRLIKSLYILSHRLSIP